MFDSVIKLISKTMSRNAVGANVETETEREVFCSVDYVGRADFYQAAQAGLDLSLVFITHPSNYAGEKEIEYEGKRYAVTRTYQKDLETMELYAGEKVGLYGSDESS